MNKYIWGSLFLIIVSIIGLNWITKEKVVQQKRNEAINAIYPTVTVTNGQPTVKKTTAPIASQSGGQATNKGGLTEESSNQTIFKSVYDSDRKLYIENEYSGVRYVLWRSDSKITVHVGNSWSWVHPRRDLTESGVVSGQKTFEYNIGSQRIVDFSTGGKKYTIQCVHNGVADFKAECDKFLINFKLL